jgi:hypothetical protein
MVDQLEAEDEAAQKQSVLVIAHLEDVASWTAAILEWHHPTFGFDRRTQ